MDRDGDGEQAQGKWLGYAGYGVGVGEVWDTQVESLHLAVEYMSLELRRANTDCTWSHGDGWECPGRGPASNQVKTLSHNI